MTVQAIPGMTSLYLPAIHPIVQAAYIPNSVDTVLDAANEEVIFLGRVWLEGRTGSKTLSAAGGGSIWWMPGAATITFANAGTTMRIGVQDVNLTSGPPGLGDGTDDVYADLVGGTDTITALTFRDTTMTSGSKDLTHGQLIAISLRLTARAGADLVRVRSPQGVGASVTTINVLEPSVTSNLGAYAHVNAIPMVVIEFDDGSYGYIDGTFVTSTGALRTSIDYNTGSTPDERGNIFRLPGPISIDGLWAFSRTSGASANFELCLYSDPLGSPSLIEAVTYDSNTIAATVDRMLVCPLATVQSLSANTDYGITIRPTTADSVRAWEFDVAATGHWTAHPMGSNCNQITRSDNAGAFAESTTKRILCGVRISGIGDDAGGSGGGGMKMVGRGGLAG